MRVGVIGAGDWAVRTHLPALMAFDSIDVIGVWSRNPSAATLAGDTFGIKPCGSLDALLGAADLVAIAVAPDAQPELARRAAQSGCHLILEKPLAPSREEVETVLAAVEEAGVRATIFASREWDPLRQDQLVELRGVATRGELSYSWESRGMLGKSGLEGWRSEAGPVVDVGPHMLPILEFCGGPIAGIIQAEALTASSARVTLAHASGLTSKLLINLGSDVPFTREAIALNGETLWRNSAAVDFEAAYHSMLTELLQQIDEPSPSRAGGDRLAAHSRAADVLDGIVRLMARPAGTDPESKRR